MTLTSRFVETLLATIIAIASLCLLVAIPVGAAVTSDVALAPTNILTAVSCPTSTFCAAVDNQGNAYTYDGTSNVWSLSVNLDFATAMTSLSCTSSSFCMAGDSNGSTYVYNGVSWVNGTSPDGSTVTGISCASTPGSCMAVTNNGNAFITSNDGNSWSSTPQPDGAPLDAVSCVASTFCVATDDAGNAFAYDGLVWDSGTSVSSFPLTSISCVTTTLCTAVDGQGNIFTYNGTLWIGASQNPIDTANGTVLTCPTTSFCLVGDANGNIYVDEHGVWSPDAGNPVDSDGGITAISCSSTSSCIVVDSSGHALVYVPPAPPVVPVVLVPQSALTVTTTSGTVGVPLTLETSGGSGVGGVTFQVTSLGPAVCTLTSSDVLTINAAGSCAVIATKASDGTYAATSSSATQVTFAAPPTPPAPPVRKRPVTRTHLITRVVGPFANDSFTLSRTLVRTVDALASVAKRSHDYRVSLAGYSSVVGSLAQNEILSLRRARAVAVALRKACIDRGISVNITVTGRGVGSASTPAADRVVDVTMR